MNVLPESDRLAIIAHGVQHPEASYSAMSRSLGIHRDTIRRTLNRYQPVVNELRTLKHDEMLAAWQWAFFDAFREMEEGSERGELKAGDRRNLAITMGIATERGSALAGMPTQIIASAHLHRHELGDVAARLIPLIRKDIKGMGDRGTASPRPDQPDADVVDAQPHGLDGQPPAAPVWAQESQPDTAEIQKGPEVADKKGISSRRRRRAKEAPAAGVSRLEAPQPTARPAAAGAS